MIIVVIIIIEKLQLSGIMIYLHMGSQKDPVVPFSLYTLLFVVQLNPVHVLPVEKRTVFSKKDFKKKRFSVQ